MGQVAGHGCQPINSCSGSWGVRDCAIVVKRQNKKHIIKKGYNFQNKIVLYKHKWLKSRISIWCMQKRNILIRYSTMILSPIIYRMLR